MDATVIKTTAFSFALLGGLATTAMSQNAYETGGVQLSFGINLRTEAQDNRSLSATDPDSSFESVARLSFGILSETRTQRFKLDFGGKLRAYNGDSTSVDEGFVEPSVALNYALSSANSRLEVSASLSETDLSDSDVLSDDGLEILRANGATRRRTMLETRLDWGDTTPLGFGIFARRLENTYSGGTPTSLGGSSVNDNLRTTVGASTRMDLTQAATLNLSFSYSEFEEDTVAGTSDTISVNSSLTLDRPHGPVSFNLGVTSVDDGERVSASVGRSMEFPNGTFSGQIGATRGVDGDGYLTAAASYSHVTPTATFTLGLSRDVSSDNEEDSERLRTSLSLGYGRDLTPLSALKLNARWSQSETTATDLSSIDTTLGATYSRELTEDWALDAGYKYRVSDDDTSGRAESNSVFLELRRAFVTRF